MIIWVFSHCCWILNSKSSFKCRANIFHKFSDLCKQWIQQYGGGGKYWCLNNGFAGIYFNAAEKEYISMQRKKEYILMLQKNYIFQCNGKRIYSKVAENEYISMQQKNLIYQSWGNKMSATFQKLSRQIISVKREKLTLSIYIPIINAAKLRKRIRWANKMSGACTLIWFQTGLLYLLYNV